MIAALFRKESWLIDGLGRNQSIHIVHQDKIKFMNNFRDTTSITGFKLLKFSFTHRGSSWLYGSWIYDYLCNQCLSPLTLWVQIPLRRGVLDTTLTQRYCQYSGNERVNNFKTIEMSMELSKKQNPFFLV